MKFTLLTTALALFSVASSSPMPDAPIAARAIASFYPKLAVNIFTPDKGTVKGDVYVFRVCPPYLPSPHFPNTQTK